MKLQFRNGRIFDDIFLTVHFVELLRENQRQRQIGVRVSEISRLCRPSQSKDEECYHTVFKVETLLSNQIIPVESYHRASSSGDTDVLQDTEFALVPREVFRLLRVIRSSHVHLPAVSSTNEPGGVLPMTGKVELFSSYLLR